MANRIIESLWDIVFPPFCVACNKPGAWWCKDCRDKVHVVKQGICPKCLKVGEHECVGDLPFDKVISAGYYHDARLRQLIARLKFSGVTIVKDDLQAFIKDRAGFDVDSGVVIVPMPLAQKRLKERGFNQAEFVAEQVKEALNLNNRIEAGLLARVKHLDPQSSLEHDLNLRSGRIEGAFKVMKQPPEHVVLVDDVVTTGATAAEAARILLAAGAKKVDLLTLAVGA